MLPPADISAIGGLITASGVIGGGIGRHVGNKFRGRQERIHAQNDLLLNLTHAMTGKPADQWGPREPGLIEQMAVLNAKFDAHLADEKAKSAAAELVLQTAKTTAIKLAESAEHVPTS